MHAKEFYDLLAKQGIRMFSLKLEQKEEMVFLHPKKTVLEWRADLRKILNEVQCNDKTGYADSNIVGDLLFKLSAEGYLDVRDLVADVFEGRIAITGVRIDDWPVHEDQPDGFGHYGFGQSEID
jgi:hypothetical protein